MFRGSVKSTGYPLHSPVSPSLPLPCVTVCHHISTGLYCIVTSKNCFHYKRSPVFVVQDNYCSQSKVIALLYASLPTSQENSATIKQIWIKRVLYEDTLWLVDSSWNVIAHCGAREGKLRGNWWMEWVASTLHTSSEHGVSSIITADMHNSAASSRLNWHPPPPI